MFGANPVSFVLENKTPDQLFSVDIAPDSQGLGRKRMCWEVTPIYFSLFLVNMA